LQFWCEDGNALERSSPGGPESLHPRRMCFLLRGGHRFSLSFAWPRSHARTVVDRRCWCVPSRAASTFDAAASKSFNRSVQSISLPDQETNNLFYFHLMKMSITLGVQGCTYCYCISRAETHIYFRLRIRFL
jgi:hypothetical protein